MIIFLLLIIIYLFILYQDVQVRFIRFITVKLINGTSELSTSFLNKLRGLDMFEHTLKSSVYSHRMYGVYIPCFLFLIS